MKPITIGILAGMGPKSTTPFLDMVIDECQKQYGATNDDDFPHMMIYSLPTPFRIEKIDHGKMKTVLIRGLKRLEKTHIDFIVMPCNFIHQYFSELKKAVKVPIINLIEEAIKNLNPELKKVALLATPSTIKSHIYQKELVKKNLNTSIPVICKHV